MHLIAVEAADAEEAINEAEHAISSYGDGDVWDWYTIGGRWEGYLGGANTLRFTDNPELFVQSVTDALKSQDATFRECKEYITGNHITLESAPDHVLGLPLNNKEGYVERHNKLIDEYHEHFKQVMTADSLSDLDHKVGMVGYYLRKLGSLVGGYYTFDSMFYDSVYGSPSAEAIKKRIVDPERAHLQHLVVVDLHN